jgi:excisionase family DNA binding protein
MSASMRKHIETTNPELNDRIAVSLDRAADILDVGKSTIYQLLRERRLRSIRFGTSHRVTMESIRELVAAAERQSA